MARLPQAWTTWSRGVHAQGFLRAFLDHVFSFLRRSLWDCPSEMPGHQFRAAGAHEQKRLLHGVKTC